MVRIDAAFASKDSCSSRRDSIVIGGRKCQTTDFIVEHEEEHEHEHEHEEEHEHEHEEEEEEEEEGCRPAALARAGAVLARGLADFSFEDDAEILRMLETR